MNTESVLGGLIIGVVVAILYIPVMVLMWMRQKKQMGAIECQRCRHVGLARGLWVPWRGIKPVCQKCRSEDWIKVGE